MKRDEFTFTKNGLKDLLEDYHEFLTNEPLREEEVDDLGNWVDLWWDDLDDN